MSQLGIQSLMYKRGHVRAAVAVCSTWLSCWIKVTVRVRISG